MRLKAMASGLMMLAVILTVGAPLAQACIISAFGYDDVGILIAVGPTIPGEQIKVNSGTGCRKETYRIRLRCEDEGELGVFIEEPAVYEVEDDVELVELTEEFCEVRMTGGEPKAVQCEVPTVAGETFIHLLVNGDADVSRLDRAGRNCDKRDIDFAVISDVEIN